MSIATRYQTADKEINWGAVVRDGIIGIAVLILVTIVWPFYSVPTGPKCRLTSTRR